MSYAATPEEKWAALRQAHALNPRPAAVVDALFTAGHRFFDARDLVQVKYEMLRRVHLDGYSVTQAAAVFGLSRPTFYQAQRAWQRGGLAGLVPARPGPRRAHKLGTAVVQFLQQARAADPHSRATQLARQVEERFGVVVHPRSIARPGAVGWRARGPSPTPGGAGQCTPDLTLQYETVRAAALGQPVGLAVPQGVAVLVQRGLPGWLAVWARWAPPCAALPPAGAGGTGGEVLPGGTRDLVAVLLSMALRGREEGER